MQNHIHQLLKSIAGVLCIFSIIFIAGCSGGTEVGNPGTPPSQGPSMTTAEQELETYLKDQYATSVLSNDAYGYVTEAVFDIVFIDMGGQVVETAAMIVNEEAVGFDVTSEDFSKTNVQETGVDEADQVKTDGTYMYVADQRKITIVKAVPPDAMSIVSTVDVNNGYIDSFYLYNDILVVLYTPDGSGGESWSGTNLVGRADVGMPYWLPVNTQTGVLLVDVTDPSIPDTIQEVRADGRLTSSRLTGGKLHVVQQFLPDLPPLELYFDGTEEDRDDAISANQQNLESLALDDLIPSFEAVDQNGNSLGSGRLVAPEDFYQPADPEGGSIVTLMTFDLNDPAQPFQSVGIIADVHLIYASTQSLYTIATFWDSAAQAIGDYDQRQQTVIHKYDLTGEKVSHVGSGRIPGQVLNQFSLGEYEGILRIATTTGRRWGATLNNHVYCLQTKDNALEIIGKLEGLAPGEDLYSARFIGTRGFLVTFVKVDPLFTLDLSDSTDPKVIGELKVPGYSDYIHPLGENHLLTIGKDTELQDEIPWYQGVQLSIFDISNFADPQLLHKEIIGDRGTSSEALNSHKAFAFWAENDLLAIPIELYEHENQPDNPWHWGSHAFSGLYVYRTTAENGFEFLGRISTSQSIDYGWTRGVFIDDSVYAVKSDAVRAADIDDIENTVNVLFLP